MAEAEVISVFDMLKVGVGPSSSHTLGPWRAIQRWLQELEQKDRLTRVEGVQVRLYGSLALTGRGHCTDKAICLALLGYDPETVPVEEIHDIVDRLCLERTLHLPQAVPFDPVADIIYVKHEQLPLHANGMKCLASVSGEVIEAVYYSVGGGFVVRGGESDIAHRAQSPPYPCQSAADLESHANSIGVSIAELVRINERTWRSDEDIDRSLFRLWTVMRNSIFRGCHSSGVLPGGLDVSRRAPALVAKLVAAVDDPDETLIVEGEPGPDSPPPPLDVDIPYAVPSGVSDHGPEDASWPHSSRNAEREPERRQERELEGESAVGGDSLEEQASAWLLAVRDRRSSFRDVLRWVSAFALAVNEENANLGRIVTAPTNGAAGVLPAVLAYHVCFHDTPVTEKEIGDFLLVAGEIGTLFKKNATISAAMGGCQAEVGVSSSMAAAALAAVNGGSVGQCLMAAEIAMEHHLGLTCDPIAGLVQIPCIERNTMGAVKAIHAANLALDGDPSAARVSLDQVIRTMWQTAQDMNRKYKETSEGGLASNIPVNVPEC